MSSKVDESDRPVENVDRVLEGEGMTRFTFDEVWYRRMMRDQAILASAAFLLHLELPGYVKLLYRFNLGVGMILAGRNHFRRQYMNKYTAMIPTFLPGNAHGYVCTAGMLLMLAGFLLLIPQTSKIGAWSLICLLIAIYPATVNAATSTEVQSITGRTKNDTLLSLALQLVLITYTFWFTV